MEKQAKDTPFITRENLIGNLTKYNPEPHYVNPMMAFMCMAPVEEQWEQHAAEYGPHDISIDIYVSDTKTVSKDWKPKQGTKIIKSQNSFKESFSKAIGGMEKMNDTYDP